MNFVKRKPSYRLFLFVLCLALAAVSMADTTGSTSGGPVTPNYNDAAGTISTGIGSMVQGVFPTLAGIMVIFLGVRVFPRLIKLFAK